MGYSYGQAASGRWVLACDNCGDVGGVSKRRCTFSVVSASTDSPTRQRLDYCPPPALCGPCLKKLGGIRALHAGCEEGALEFQAEADATQALLDSGLPLRRAAWGDWQHSVPKGMVGVLFRGTAGEVAYLMPAAAYDAITLAVPASPDDYRAVGELVEIPVAELTSAPPKADTAVSIKAA